MHSVADKDSYLSVLVFGHATAEVCTALDGVRRRLRAKDNQAVTVGIGPRYLHSTGQLHKGGGNTGVFLVVVASSDDDMKIPGKPFTFGTLLQAQGIGDFQTLGNHERRAVLVTVSQAELAETLDRLN